MPDQETISQYLERLELQRKRVQHLRRQQLLQGSSVSFGIVTELAEAQADIAHIKEWLRSQHIDVEDLPDDQSQAEQHTHRRQAILAALVAYLRRHKRPLLSALALSIWTFADLRQQASEHMIRRALVYQLGGTGASNCRDTTGGRGTAGPVRRPVSK